MKSLTIFLVLIVHTTLMAQSDFEESSEVKEEYNLAPGLYPTFEDFIYNQPVPPESIISDGDPESRGFYQVLFQEKEVTYRDNDKTITTDKRSIWGFNDGTGVFINRLMFPKDFLELKDLADEQFARVNFLGRLSLVYYVKTVQSQLLNPSGNQRMTTQVHSKPAEFILDTRDGSFHKATLPNLEKLIADDPDLLEEFKNHKKEKDIKLYIFLKKYNARNSLEFK